MLVRIEDLSAWAFDKGSWTSTFELKRQSLVNRVIVWIKITRQISFVVVIEAWIFYNFLKRLLLQWNARFYTSLFVSFLDFRNNSCQVIAKQLRDFVIIFKILLRKYLSVQEQQVLLITKSRSSSKLDLRLSWWRWCLVNSLLVFGMKKFYFVAFLIRFKVIPKQPSRDVTFFIC